MAGSKRNHKSAGAQAVLWLYAVAGLIALVPSAMNDEMAIALTLLLVALYVVGCWWSTRSASYVVNGA